MEVEKRRSKGGFLNLFDWNGKSRKKLFSASSESSGLKQGKENVESFQNSGLCRVEVDESGTGTTSSNKGSGEWNCASSVTSDEGSKARAPGVVARLMGLDSLPALTAPDPEPSSAQLFDSQSLKASQYERSGRNLWSDLYAMEYINVPKKLDRFSWNLVEPRTQGVPSHPIERFQTEALPPKSAKSIPVTHHKLLSPIKNPGFIPPKNAAYVMEAASKIIEASPRASARSKMSSVGPSSIPLRIRDLKEKMEAVHKASGPERPKEASDFRYMKGLPSDRCHNGSDNVPVAKASVDSEKQSYRDVRNKGKSVSLAEQAKVNIQKGEGSTSCRNRSFMNQKEQNEVKQNQFSKSKSSTQRSMHKRTSIESARTALKQNNQKQNCVSNRDKMTSKSMVPNQPTRRMRPPNGSTGPMKTVNKTIGSSEIGSRKLASRATANGKEFSLSTRKNVSGKIRSVHQDDHSEETVSDDSYIGGDERSVKCNVSRNGCSNLGTDNRNQGMDVISFTFTSPLKRSFSELQSPGQLTSINNSFYIDSSAHNDQQFHPENFTLSSPGLNVIGGDALSVLLEQKLQELSCKVESSQRNQSSEVTSGSSTSCLQDMVSSVASTTSRGKGFKFGLTKHKTHSTYDNGCLSVEVNQQWQGSEGVEECISSIRNSATGKEFDRRLSPVSVFEHSFESRSTNGSDTERCSLAQVQDQGSSFSSYGVSEFLDSASSASTGDASGKSTTIISGSYYFNQTNDWELEYVRYILSNVDLEMEEFALGDAQHVITPSLFDHLDNQEQEEYLKLEQKILFDCVNETLQFRCKQIFVGSRKAWDRLTTLSQRKGRLAEELYKEISGCKNMVELIGDELVDKDMSTQRGKWLDFEVEAFEEGLEIEKGILNCLVDELVSDFLNF
ncbi:hypothetical protein D8674_007765 [Pyrus ussuriensis x Pyrus communis]|uniref:DUF4378 domain-containing protein n=1 Tax=Pyrus ussuriensis x Pyrus communis TaxID=2448454 RepID=A0A5N5HQX6_9ROSA|nr:hypothetical protein D8674_007765 [Pyrus ussuriensis x Pyrus communis]